MSTGQAPSAGPVPIVSPEAGDGGIDALRRMALGALVLVMVQAGIGMAVNLYASIPPHHPGAHPSNYLSGSVHSVAWAVGHGAVTLALHTLVGLALIVMTVSVAVRSRSLHRASVSAWSILAVVLVIGAAFNGASFLDFNSDISSLIMALLAFGAALSYGVVLYLLGSPAHQQQ